MKCRKCRKEIPVDFKYCNYCGTAQKQKDWSPRSDGLYEKILTIDGKRVAFRAKTKAGVLRKISEHQKKQEESNNIKAQGRGFKQVAEDWKEEHFKTIEHNTQQSYIAPYNRLIAFFDSTPIKTITAQEADSYLQSLKAKNYAYKTVRDDKTVLNLIFTWALIHGDIDNNFIPSVPIPKNLSRGKRELPSDEQIEIVKKSLHRTFGLFPYLVLNTGLRKGEARALQVKDIDFQRDRISVTKSVYDKDNKPYIKAPKTSAGIREALIISVLKPILQESIKGKPESAYLFSEPDGSLMTANTYRNLWGQYCRESGLSVSKTYTYKNRESHSRSVNVISMHQLRHGYATILFDAGVEPKDAQDLLGHSSINETYDIYTHIRQSRKQKTLEKLNVFTRNSQ